MGRLDLDSYSGAGSAEKSGDPDVTDSAHLAGVPDEFQRLWTPHRMVYIQTGQQPSAADCPFCFAPRGSDEDGLIVARGVHAFVLLNLFPYNSGHLLVCPYRHISTYDLATSAEIAEIGELTQTAMRVIRQVSRNDGFNIGMNQGEVAGAGIAGHLHQHIVPRWAQDANFMPIIAKTKALPQLLGDVRRAVSNAWPIT
ncbi:HIT domain-containing protein [Klugiella xanthotipulae]|uniref:ATP adenylyltransferase n=1 Tax=Klugiella xanthotipulae TaxID=244735 RepID=A0A543HS90_9MICO|nr:HIT domain-containing protein [Klugiella xanthotipulae]TQM61193.1 ATP adenylyltransferase [Klugiella xanthotipulae]